ncbi:MAG: MTH1187 family thiamine-binding protein [Verrucomicrobia bacterium]|nr:MTH1187 family thiamine-binding protein [Verrucomicrobiota bacterium]
MVLLEFSIFPIGKGESVSRYVARSLDIIDRSGLDYRLHAMGTVLEGEWDECMAVVRACYDAMRKECGRVECVIKIDYRKGRRGRLQSKVASVEKRLGRKLKKA